MIMMLMLPGSGLGALVDVDKLGQTRRSVSLPPLHDVRVGVEGSSCPHKAATLGEKHMFVHHRIHKHLSHKQHQHFDLDNRVLSEHSQVFSQYDQSETTKDLISREHGRTLRKIATSIHPTRV